MTLLHTLLLFYNILFSFNVKIFLQSAQTTAATLDNLMSHDQATGESKSLERPWHGAEGVHFYLLAHRQLYDGEVEAGKRKDFIIKNKRYFFFIWIKNH